MERVDAALEWPSGKVYLFGGDSYVRVDPESGQPDAGYPKLIAGSWPGLLFDSDLSAALLWNSGKAYFFKGDEYIGYDIATDRAEQGYPRKIADGWPGVFESDIDAAVLWPNGKAYFFRGNLYVRFDVASHCVDPGYPKSIAGGWPGLFAADLDDAAHWKPDQVVFFSRGEFAMYHIAADRSDPPQSIPAAWFGQEPGLSEQPSDTPTGSLSERRKFVLDTLLPDVLPSKYGEAKFTKLTFGLTKDNPNVTPGYTTCGSLPMYIARMLNDKVISGTNGLRTAGQSKNAWIIADGSARPRPGDLYALLNQGVTDVIDGGIAHVGVIVDASEDIWKTADAGQGDGWAADYVSRAYGAQAVTLSGEVVKTTGARPPRTLAGWIDIDLYPFSDGR